jgi:hypothetical protein
MFDGELVWVRSFEVVERFDGPRLRMRAIVNGEPCFVKTHGDVQRQCLADELKPMFGLRKVGCSWAFRVELLLQHGIEDWVVIARFHEHDGMLRQAGRPEHVPELARILLFDVWIQNNDRTGNNVLVQGAHLLPIDESAAFKRDATARIGPTWVAQLRNGPWCAPGWAETVVRAEASPMLQAAFRQSWMVEHRWRRLRDVLVARLGHLEALWQQFVETQLRQEIPDGEAQQTV